MAQAPLINLPPGFRFQPQDPRLGFTPTPQPFPKFRKGVAGVPAAPVQPSVPTPTPTPTPTPAPQVPEAPLGVLENFKGKFHGIGLNTIFRPNSGETTFKIPVPGVPEPPNENVLEINLTTETLDFSPPLGSVPNRGLMKQTDIFLNGVSYVQGVQDVTNPDTGKADASPSGIHFEPGIWMHVPATTVVPVLPDTLTRMASIPHGTTINAQGKNPANSSQGPPPFEQLPKVDISPFQIGNPSNKIRFPSQDVNNAATPRLPQDLSLFVKQGTITQRYLDNPNLILGDHIKGQNITKTFTFTVSTNPINPFIGGGTGNIDFLSGGNPNDGQVHAQIGPNADVALMTSIFWVETVQHDIQIPIYKKGDPPITVTVRAASPTGQAGPTFVITPPRDITAPRLISVNSTQIQYMQTVNLNFAQLTWPHISCATLIPTDPIVVGADPFN